MTSDNFSEVEINNRLKELDKDQQFDINKAIERGDFPDYSKNIANGNGNGKTDKKINPDREFIDSINKMLDDSDEDNDKKSKHKRKITTFKYSQLGKGDLYESVFINNGLPVFINYNEETNSYESTAQIEETTRILTPPSYEECPFLRYEFENLEEINKISKFIDDNNVDFDYLYYNSYSIVSKYNNQSKYKLRIAAIKIVTSHFQDRFPTTEYLYPVGANGSGKSSIAETFRAIGYRTVVMTDPSAANLFRLLGIVEPVQCTMVLEEADKIDKVAELMAVLKTGYAWHGTVPKINPFTNKQEFFYAYCPKVIVSERSLNQSIAKGVSSRTFPIPCTKRSIKFDIKEVLNPTNTGGPQKEKLLKELMDFRKLLLVFRLRHFKDPIPDLDIGVEGRDKELVKHSIQLFNGCKCLDEVTETLQKFLDIKNEKKESTIESILLSIVWDLIQQNNGKSKIASKDIWEELISEVTGKIDEKKPNEYHSDDYGTIYRNATLATYLGDSFGGVVKHTNKGNVWIFDTETIESMVKDDKTKIVVSEVEEEEEKVKAVNTMNTPDIGGSKNLEKNNEEKELVEQEIENPNIKNNKNIKKIDTPLLHIPSLPSLPSPIHRTNENKQEEPKLLFNNSLISESDLKDPNGFQYDPEIINNIDRFSNSDQWYCKKNQCKVKGDKWLLMRHNCNYKNKNKSES